MMRTFLLRSLGVTLLVQFNGAQAQELLLRPPTTTNPCSANPNIYTQADMTSAQAELELRRNQLRRMRGLAEAGVVPRTELDEAVYQERLASIRLRLAQIALSPRTQVTEVEAMAQLSHAQAELDLRSLQVRRLERLADEQAVPLSQLLEALQEERKARANLEKARACLRKLIR
jgi:multidrug resistance efflux pump